MKKTLFILGLFLSVAFLYAQRFEAYQLKASCLLQTNDVEEVVDLSPAAPDICKNARNLTVNFSANCQTAEITWLHPVDTLWNNTEPIGEGYSGFRSIRMLGDGEGEQRMIFADDFEVPSGEVWNIFEVYYAGFYRATGANYIAPDYLGIEIYDDDGGVPAEGQPIFEDSFLRTVSGNFNATLQTVRFEEPVVLPEGRYWISIFGVYDDEFDDEKHGYILHLFDEEIGNYPLAFLNEGYSPWATWEHPTNPAYNHKSMYFRIFGNKKTEPFRYNLYRNTEPIENAQDITGNKFIDTDFDYSITNRYSIKQVCEEELSGGINATKNPCTPVVGIANNATASFSIVPNPATNNITITSASRLNTIEIINFLGQTVISQQANNNKAELDIANLTKGVYFVRITTDNGTSAQKFVKQ